MKIGIFGGTFDPIHLGHLALARNAKDQFGLDKVLFIPALVPPHKAGRRDLTPAPYRYRMVELAIRDESHFEISDIEFNRPSVSYTVDTLRMLRERYPQDEFFLIIGADSLAELDQWHEKESLLKLAQLLVASRPGTEKKSYGHPVSWIEMEEIPFSSSEIRNQIAAGKKTALAYLPNGVGQYIDKMNLYRERPLQ